MLFRLRRLMCGRSQTFRELTILRAAPKASSSDSSKLEFWTGRSPEDFHALMEGHSPSAHQRAKP
jgi:hypothetical protein